jgi:NTE family protein
MRHSAPIGAAIHLGANRAVVVGAGRMNAPQDEAPGPIETNYPSLAQIAGHALANIFLDALVADVEMVRRINQTLSLVPPEIQSASILRPVELLVITPSQHLDAIAARHVSALPATVRSILGIGNNSKTRDARGAALASYLLFESSYTSELMALGYADVKKLQGQVCTFFGWTDARAEKEGAGAQPERTERRRDPLRLR